MNKTRYVNGFVNMWKIVGYDIKTAVIHAVYSCVSVRIEFAAQKGYIIIFVNTNARLNTKNEGVCDGEREKKKKNDKMTWIEVDGLKCSFYQTAVWRL